MAIRPCIRCGRRFVGKAQHLYVTILDGVEETRSKGALCPNCFDFRIDWLVTHTQMIPEGGLEYEEVAGAHQCIACGEDVNDNSVVFATDYATKSDRRDWYSPLCKAHAQDALLALAANQLSGQWLDSPKMTT